LLRHCYVEGGRAKDVAVELNRSPAAVYKALERIRVMLHGCIERKIAKNAY
jgi:hypothetical protein